MFSLLLDTYSTYLCFLFSFLNSDSISDGFLTLNSNQGALEVMNAMKTSDLIGIQKGLGKVAQSLKKMRETLKLMHSKFELNLTQIEIN